MPAAASEGNRRGGVGEEGTQRYTRPIPGPEQRKGREGNAGRGPDEGDTGPDRRVPQAKPGRAVIHRSQQQQLYEVTKGSGEYGSSWDRGS